MLLISWFSQNSWYRCEKIHSSGNLPIIQKCLARRNNGNWFEFYGGSEIVDAEAWNAI